MSWSNYGGGGFSSTGSSMTFGGMAGQQYRPPPSVDETKPHLVGYGPAEMSSSTVLAKAHEVCFDVNGYYRTLGVPWPYKNATKATLMKCYREKVGAGQNAPNADRLTYYLKQLLNPVIRRIYDEMPFGVQFVDMYVEQAIKRQMQEMVRQRQQDIWAANPDATEVDERVLLRDIAEEMGIPIQFNDEMPDTPEEVIDTDLELGQGRTSPPRFEFAYYLWRAARPVDADQRLLDWQALIVRELSAVGARVNFSLGLMSKSASRWAVAEVGFRTVIFLHTEVEPDAEVANKIAAQLHPLTTKGH